MSTDEFIAPHCAEEIGILFEDEDLLVIEKPSGLLSLSGRNPLNKDSVHDRLFKQYAGVAMVHRLDIGTSGLMILARNKAVNSHLTKQFQARTISKTYVALLYGHVIGDQGVIDVPIAKDQFPRQKACFQTGKLAQSPYQVTERFLYGAANHNSGAGYNDGAGFKVSRVIFTPASGRTHQLRIHSQYIGHPIIGCDLYGDVIDGLNTLTLSNRLCLHASHLEFEHPTSGERLCFESECNF